MPLNAPPIQQSPVGKSNKFTQPWIIWFNSIVSNFVGFEYRSSSINYTETGQGIYFVTGTPEGSVTAPVGSLALRSDGGAGTSLYVKESGAGNTGWVAK